MTSTAVGFRKWSSVYEKQIRCLAKFHHHRLPHDLAASWVKILLNSTTMAGDQSLVPKARVFQTLEIPGKCLSQMWWFSRKSRTNWWICLSMLNPGFDSHLDQLWITSIRTNSLNSCGKPHVLNHYKLSLIPPDIYIYISTYIYIYTLCIDMYCKWHSNGFQPSRNGRFLAGNLAPWSGLPRLSQVDPSGLGDQPTCHDGGVDPVPGV